MTKSMKANKELNRIFTELQSGYEKMNVKQQRFALREFKRIQLEITEILIDSTGANGKISRARFTTIQRQLAGLEKRMLQTGEIVMDKVIQGASRYATQGIDDGFVASFGASIGASLGGVNENVVEYVTKRFYDDGLVLSDRIWTTSANIHAAVEKEIRSGIILGRSVSEMVPRVRKAFDAETWQIKRLVKTEGMTAYRTASAMAAEQSEVVDWVQMHKGLADLPFHECTILSLEDRYGEGAGIFKPTDSEVYNPHPNCTGFITYVVKDDYTLEGLRKRFAEDSGVKE